MRFLHGWPGIGLLWRAQIEAFASEGWRCIAPDMRRLWRLIGAGCFRSLFIERSRGVIFISVPYSPEAFALPSLLPLIDRKLYPAEQYPDGHWDYYRFCASQCCLSTATSTDSATSPTIA
jgi:hypothetical protein